MSCDDTSRVEHAELHSSLIGLFNHLQQQYCPRLNVCEFLISPDLIQQYPLDNLPDSKLFEMRLVAQSMLLHKKGVPSYKDGRGFLTVKELPFEPYHQLSSSSICQLLNPNLANQLVPSSQLQELRQFFSLPSSMHMSQTLGELKEDLDRLSVFAGRSPLEVAELNKEDYLSQLARSITNRSIPLSMNHLLIECESVSKWHALGIQLGLTTSRLNDIHDTFHAHGVKRLKTEMFDVWLNSSPKASWTVLITALRNMDENRVANDIIAKTVYSESPILDVLAVQAGGWQQMRKRFFNAYKCELILTTLLVLGLCALLLYYIWR